MAHAQTHTQPQALPPRDRDRRLRREALLTEFFAPPVQSSRYHVDKVIGEGAYGVVVAAKDLTTGHRVAVKRIKHVLDSAGMATRILRELKFLRFLHKHENIISLKDVLLPCHRDRFNDVFLVLELMPTDLGRLLRSRTVLSPQHVTFFMFQLLRAVNFMHSANVFHRDLNPNNILVNSDCQLRVCDFGLARAAFQQGEDNLFWTDYVATRWYRAPELVLRQTCNYSTAIDMWSVGCIFAEMLGRGRPLFPGQNRDQQFLLILNVTGKPPRDVMERLADPHMAQYVNSLPNRQPTSLAALYRDADPQAIDLLYRLLAFDPAVRITAAEALALPYFDDHRSLGLGATTEPLDAREFAFERTRLSAPEMRNEFLKEIMAHHPSAMAEMQERAEMMGVGARRCLVPSNADQFSVDMIAEENKTRRQNRTLSTDVFAEINPAQQPQADMMEYKHSTMSEAELARINN